MTRKEKIQVLQEAIRWEMDCLKIVEKKLYIAEVSGNETQYILSERQTRENTIARCAVELERLKTEGVE